MVEFSSPKGKTGVRILVGPPNMYVYHSSKTQGLKTIEPRISTHEKSWVYALKSPEHSILFMGNNHDLINQIGNDVNGELYIFERFAGALEHAYKGEEGSIYTLDAGDFKAGMTSWDPEVICEHACPVIKEEKIDNVLDKILELDKESKIKVYRFPNRPPGVPADNSDLIDKAARWASRPGKAGEHVLEEIKKYLPDLLDKVKERMKQGAASHGGGDGEI